MRGERGAVRLAIVVPCFNEEAALPACVQALAAFLDSARDRGEISADSFIVLVDDGSRDGTWMGIEEAARRYPGMVRGIRLARNVGHQGALLCGLTYVTDRCDAAVSIDADLQDDVEAIREMIALFQEGKEIVLGVREAREVDTWFKRTTAVGFYRVMRWMGVDLVENHADFRLMSNAALRNLREFPEVNLFLRGLVPLLHQRVGVVYYRRRERVAGESKYPLRKMLSLAWNGITSFSVMPLRLVTLMGALVFFVSLGLAGYAFWGWASGRALPGWTSTVIPMYLLGGLLMLSLGVVGEYVGKVFLEAKRRPRFLVDRLLGDGES